MVTGERMVEHLGGSDALRSYIERRTTLGAFRAHVKISLHYYINRPEFIGCLMPNHRQLWARYRALTAVLDS